MYPLPAAGFSLVEMIICIVVISIALTGVMSAIIYANRNSADPLIRQQAITLAQGMMEEVMLRNFLQSGSTSSCPPSDGQYDNICDYNGYTETPPAPLDHYTVAVRVVPTDDLGVAGSPQLDILGSANDVLRIDVTVTHDSGASVTLSAYRTNY